MELKTNPRERLSAILIVVVALLLLLIPAVSALDFDNTKRTMSTTFDGIPTSGNKLLERYMPIKITNAFGLGRTLFEGYISKHNDTCGIDCESTMRINLHDDGMLVEDIIFKTLQGDLWVEQNIRSFQFSYLGTIEDYRFECEEEILGNGTVAEDCVRIDDGSHQGWIRYEVGEEVSSGIYTLKLDADKKPSRTVDWIIKTNGEWLESWATWGNITGGDDAEILLNSPVDDYVALSSLITFNCSANVTGGSALNNMSVYTNESGTWEAKNTTAFDIESLGLISYYKFDGATGATAVDSVDTNDGTVSGVTRNVTGIINKSFDFESSDPDFVDMNAVILPTGASDDFTISAWINPESFNGTETSIVNQNSGGGGRLIFNLDGTGKVRIFIGGSSVLTTSEIDTGLWSHVLAKRAGTNVSLWVNGTHIGSFAKGDGIDNTDTEIGRGSATGNYFDGLIDEVAFWNRSITATEISDIYNSGSATRPGAPTFFTQTWDRTIAETSLWTCQACDSDGDCGFSTTNRTLLVDSSPPLISVESPNGTIAYSAIGQSETLNVTFTDVSLDSCWYDYNGTNITIAGCETGVKNSTTFILEDDNSNMTLYGNDSLGNLKSQFESWNYSILETARSYETSAVEGTSSLFTINASFFGGLRLSSANLIYNGTAYSASSNEYETNKYLISYTHNLPTVSADTNITFFWNITLEGGDVIPSLSNNQTVSDSGVDDCSVFTNVLFNFTSVDETTQVILDGATQNTSIKIDFTLSNINSGEEVLNLTQFYNQTNPAAICMKSPLGDSEFKLDGVVEYTASSKFVEFYNIQNFTLSNSTNNQNVTLYNLKESEGQEFKITYKGEDFVAVNDLIVQIQRKYIEEGVFKTIEIPMSGTNGYTIAHLVPNDVIYNLIFLKDGAILDTFSNVIANCQNPSITECEINLNALISGEDLFDIITDGEFSSTLSYNKDTRIATSVYTIISGVPGLVQFNTTLLDNFGNTTVCSDSLLAAGGTLTCTVPDSFGNATVYSVVTYNDKVRNSGFISLKQSPQDQYGGVLIMSSVILLLFIFGMGISDSPMVMGIFLMIGAVLLVGLNLVYSTSIIGAGATVLWFIVAVIVVLIKGGGKR